MSPSTPPARALAVRRRGIPILLCLLATAACLAYGAWRRDLPGWWKEYGGGIPYVVFWIAFGFVLIPIRNRALAISVGVTLITCSLETLQLWHPAWLSGFRNTTLGAALLGGVFTWGDFPPYWIGGAVGYGLLMLAGRFMQEPGSP